MAGTSDEWATRARLDVGAIDQLQRLIRSWGMLADFCFSDLVLYVPDLDGRFLIAKHIRPTTSQTIYDTEIVGEVRSSEQRPLIHQAFDEGTICRGDIDSAWLGERVRVAAIPVRRHDRAIAVVAREFVSAVRHHPGVLEQTYEAVFDRFAAMICAGTFPFPDEDSRLTTMPRVGDGVMVLDRSGAIEYLSPNATSTFTRGGVVGPIRGTTLSELGLDAAVFRTALSMGRPEVGELELDGDVVVAIRVLPFLDGVEVTGAVVLLRDISDLRRRDRLLISKDATISEIHHRVKNNLQTISSLLRIQGRALSEPSARAAIEEAGRRIHSIALVHETLSREPGDDVAFRDVLKPLVRMVNEGLVSAARPIGFELSGDGGVVSSEVATSLSLVVTELLQNAVEHAFPGVVVGPAPLVNIDVSCRPNEIAVVVADNGVGLPAGSPPQRPESLGQAIVHALVTDELRGTISYASGQGSVDRPGTVVTVVVPPQKNWA